jgi:N utilization substance protein A
MKGMRVQSIIRELRGEKIDIIEYHEDAVTFAEKALQPAKVSRVSIVDSHDKHLEVIVDDTQLSLAIGKKGQNVRLAAKLLGWKIDIKSEEEKRQEVEQQMNSLVGNSATSLENIAAELGDPVLEKLSDAGITSVESLADMTPEELEAIPGIGPETVERISVAVNNYFSTLESAEQVASAENVDPEYASDPLLAADASLVSEAAPSEGPAEEQSGEPAEAAQDSGETASNEVENAPATGEDEVHTHGEHPGEQDIDPANK